MNNTAVERCSKIIESIKADIGMHERSNSEYGNQQAAELRTQLAKREAILAELTK